ncbi:glycosyltransferase 87 family protein [Amycolatopsis mongoliensis]|uniref:Glycosyltransferase 87 family protein n=1 Tax=Amycolatopsis mongoliensis TaxID=715475 RepID=A0A9Y2K133_9PSEU|nr:glycosyltransferase 87 family protein [Amycolatopsis sp. 4-36]WIY06619.1 glycosyltransferase 87 family protein [Amycolatopsis sp. 4-36]
MAEAVDPEAPVERKLPAPLWWSVLSGLLLLVAVVGYTVWTGLWTATGVYLEDFVSYVATGRAVRAGQPLFEPGVSHLPMIGGTFKYTPFAAGVFVALSVVPQLLLPMVALLGNLFALLAVVWIALGKQGYAPDHGRVAATAALTALALPLQPVLMNFTVGQVNLILVLLVLADLTGRDRWWSGVGVGVAAGIKLTPGFFIVYLLLARRFRAAAVAAGTFVLTVLAGFVALPHDSSVFWSANVADPSRITGTAAGAMSPENQSVRGMVSRLLGVADPSGPAWIPVAVVVALVALWIAVRAHRQGRELLAVSVVGVAMVLVTPWTWTHYWVWLVPFFVMAACGALRSRTWLPAAALVVAYLLVFGWRVSDRADVPIVGLVVLPESHPPLLQAVAHTLYLALAAVLLALAALRPGWLSPRPLKIT